MAIYRNVSLLIDFQRVIQALNELHQTLLKLEDVMGAEALREDINKYKSWLDSILKEVKI